ncbi:MAG: glycoside hydrolase 43 family protein [Nibricoccus sp.]
MIPISRILVCLVVEGFVAFSSSCLAAAPAPWVADNGDGTYKNPILYQDFSDPDVVRVGGDYYLTCSTFHVAPGLTLLHSRDMVNWSYLTNPLKRLVPGKHFEAVRPSAGVWAPSIRHHDGKFWIFYPDPDFGIYVISAENPAGPWTEPHLLIEGKGLIDPCPLWDEDGRAYVVHGWAKSRAGIGNRLTVREISPDCTKLLDEGVVAIDGDKLPGYRTLEGPKFYKRDGWYYIFAPAGGVRNGWQSVFRSKNVRGPYEDRIVLEQGNTPINGPHQGAWVDTPSGESWFFHFQEIDALGRVTHLQPMIWKDGWPVMGEDPDGDGKGQPVLVHKKPTVSGAAALATPQVSDEFDGKQFGPQWQWSANDEQTWSSLSAERGVLRLFVQPENEIGTLWHQPAVLTQRISGPASTVTTKLAFASEIAGASAGLVMMGDDYAWIGLRREGNTLRVVLKTGKGMKNVAPKEEIEVSNEPWKGGPIWLRVTNQGEKCRFSYSDDGKTFKAIGGEFVAKQWGSWVGARVGLFAMSPRGTKATGHADVDWFHVTAPENP